MTTTNLVSAMHQNFADFENLEQKYQAAIQSSEYQQLVKLVDHSKKIYVVANGGLHYVGSHMATDLTRLVPGKVVKSFDSFGFISSNANDHGWENTFVRWLETSAILDDPDTTMVYGMSCSGNSTNVINTFDFARERFGFKSFLLSGRPSKCKPAETIEICLNAEYYHTVETIGLMLFYDLVHKLGHACPVINR
jgi:phosphoheptose isomerase